MNDVSEILEAFIPNRAYRRKNQGAGCTMCGLGIVAVDLALVTVVSNSWVGGKATSTRPIHKQCTALLWEEVARLEALAAEEE